jgi:type IV pilus assembly protein PilY1
MAAFTLGAPAAAGTPSVKSGWFFDLAASIGERQVSDMTAANNRLILASLFPTRGSCGEGGGRIYSLDPLSGRGYSVESTVGVLAAPLVLNMGSPTTDPSRTTGRRMSRDRIGVIAQGAKGLLVTPIVDTFEYPTGRISWRLINNHETNVTPTP